MKTKHIFVGYALVVSACGLLILTPLLLMRPYRYHQKR